MNSLWNILKKELMELFRDKKSLMMMLMIPIMIPSIVIGFSAMFDTQATKIAEEYNKIGFSYELSDVEKSIAKELKIEVTEESTEELENLYQEGKIDIYITRNGSNYTLNGEEKESTTYAFSLATNYLNIYKQYLQNEYLTDHKVDANEVLNILTISENIKVKENYFANYITTYGFIFIIMGITVSSTYPATDTTAGEKERGTLETLLTFPIKARDIIIGKFLSVSLSNIITGLLCLILLAISLNVAGDKFEIYKGVNLSLSFITILYLFVVIVAYSFLVSGLCIAIASKAKTFKEAQSALTPLTLIAVFPAMIVFLVDIKSSTILSLIPFVNFTLLFEEISKGTVNVLNLFLMLISTLTLIAIVLTIIIKQYKSEKILFQ